MKQLLFLSGILFVGLMACGQKTPSSPRVTAVGNGVKVDYGQPSKKGRAIFGGLQKYGEVWRVGANEATEITFEKDATFGGKQVKAGTYTLFAIPNENEWTVILNGDTKFWGTQYEQHKSKDVLQVNVPVKKTENVVEKLTYRFAGDDMIIEWDQAQVLIPVKAV